MGTDAATPFRYQYAAKFICTANIPGTSQTTSSVLPGAYATAINIHNRNEQTARLREKIALGPEVHSDWVGDGLGDDGMRRIDCSQIVERFGPFIHGAEGFLVIESTESLDVVAVYTAGPNGGEVTSIDVEQVTERVLRQG